MSNRYPPGTELALNFSIIKHILTSPRHFQLAFTSEFEETIAMRLGTMAHEWLLLGKKPEYVIRPESNDEGDAWNGSKKWCKKWKAEHSDMTILTQDEADRQTALMEALSNHHGAAKLIDGAAVEVPLFAEIDGVPFRGIPDARKGNQIIDLKTTVDASPAAFAKQAYANHYDLQMIVYQNLAAIQLEEFSGTWIVAEKKTAVIVIYHLGADFIESGIRKLKQCIDTYRECLTLYGDPRNPANKWTGYSDGVILNPPKWANRDE